MERGEPHFYGYVHPTPRCADCGHRLHDGPCILTAAATVPDLTDLVRSENAQMIEVIESMHGRLREAEALLRRWIECVARGRTNAQNVLHDETEAWL